MYTSIKTHNVRLSILIMPRVNKRERERERERERDLFYRTLDIEINYYLLKYWNFRKQIYKFKKIDPLLFQVFSSLSFRSKFIPSIFLFMSFWNKYSFQSLK